MGIAILELKQQHPKKCQKELRAHVFVTVIPSKPRALIGMVRYWNGGTNGKVYYGAGCGNHQQPLYFV